MILKRTTQLQDKNWIATDWNERKPNHCLKTLSNGGIDLSAGLMFNKVMYMKSSFAINLIFSITTYADNGLVWDDEVLSKNFGGYPHVLGYVHDLPKTALSFNKNILSRTERFSWETGVAAWNPWWQQNFNFNREKLTFGNSM